jgi:hypothetical protein
MSARKDLLQQVRTPVRQSVRHSVRRVIFGTAPQPSAKMREANNSADDKLPSSAKSHKPINKQVIPDQHRHTYNSNYLHLLVQKNERERKHPQNFFRSNKRGRNPNHTFGANIILHTNNTLTIITIIVPLNLCGFK